jgi:serine/threonine protein kinase
MPTGPNDETIVPATASPGSAGFFAASPPPAEPVDPVLDAQQAIGGRYRLSGLAGQGAMGRVFVAADSVLERKVAIKMLQSARVASRVGQESWSAEDRERLLSEARAMAGLNHPNACRVLEVCFDPPPGSAPERFAPFIVMEWVDGVALDESWRGTDLATRLSQFTRIVEATAALHGAGLVHQDLKPSNILIDRRGQPSIVDFGLARGRRRDGQVAGGTPGWAAPEQLRAVRGESSRIDARADVFALGVILYQLLTDRLPFEGRTVEESMDLTMRGVPELPETVNPLAPAALQRMCLMAIDPEPSRRYADAGGMLADLRRHEAGETVTARPAILLGRFAEQVESMTEQLRRWAGQELITREESRLLGARLAELQRPESPWILDSRRLSGSQVSLYLGGWLLTLALTIGVWNAHDALTATWTPLAWLVPVVTAAAVLAAGMALHARNHRRTSLAFFVTSSLCLPAAAWQCIRNARLLLVEATEPGRAETELFGSDAGEFGLQNLQLTVTLAIGVAGSLVFRRFSGSSAFTLVGCLFCIPLWGWLWLSAGRLVDRSDRATIAELGAWMVIAGGGLLASGALLNRREERVLATLGPARFRTADAWPIVATGAIVLVAASSVIAWNVPELLLFQRLPVPTEGTWRPEADSEVRAGAFLVVGVLLLVLSWAISLRPTALLDRTARGLRWIIPSYLLFPMAWLEFHDAAPGWGLWFVLLALGALAAVFASAAAQWKPFMLTGLLYLAEWYVRAFDRLEQAASGRPILSLALMAAMAATGLSVMLAAWWLSSRPRRQSRTASGIGE